MHKKIKKSFSIFIAVLIALIYSIYDIKMLQIRSDALHTTGSYASKTPWGMIYVVVGIMVLYFLGKIPFFKKVQIEDSQSYRKQYRQKDRKTKNKEMLATFIFGLLVLAFGIGFVILVFRNMN